MTSASSPLLPAQQTIELTLIPLRIGVLPLPRLHVTVQARASPFLVAHTVYRHTHTKVFVLPGGPMEPAVASKPSWGDEPPTVAVSDGPDVDGNTGHGYSSRSNTAYASQVIVTADAQGTLAARADPAFIRQ
ncbi:hypothetical protein H4R34_004547 [Dimargaris verticillata]|uniref:Uncharacterized protein n=1 Tax=Dimargaris verticillata TaxID=2761393 RepID=A0A9W8B0E4_9FUNG|nr:hypothetical protein H4R34_004547 [Dimargaris verticillata]